MSTVVKKGEAQSLCCKLPAEHNFEKFWSGVFSIVNDRSILQTSYDVKEGNTAQKQVQQTSGEEESQQYFAPPYSFLQRLCRFGFNAHDPRVWMDWDQLGSTSLFDERKDGSPVSEPLCSGCLLLQPDCLYFQVHSPANKMHACIRQTKTWFESRLANTNGQILMTLSAANYDCIN